MSKTSRYLESEISTRQDIYKENRARNITDTGKNYYEIDEQVKLSPMNFNAMFGLSRYYDFIGVKNSNHDYLSILGLCETEITMQEIDIFTFEDKYREYLSPEQAARELFIGTATIINWYRKDNSISSLQLQIGSRMVPYFSKEYVVSIRESHGLGQHDDTTILKDFEDFIDLNERGLFTIPKI